MKVSTSFFRLRNVNSISPKIWNTSVSESLALQIQTGYKYNRSHANTVFLRMQVTALKCFWCYDLECWTSKMYATQQWLNVLPFSKFWQHLIFISGKNEQNDERESLWNIEIYGILLITAHDNCNCLKPEGLRRCSYGRSSVIKVQRLFFKHKTHRLTVGKMMSCYIYRVSRKK